MDPASTVFQTSIRLRGKGLPGAEDRQRKIAGFDQEALWRSTVLCVGAGGIVSQIAPTLARKGVGGLILLDDDIVEVSNLNRQRFYEKDLGHNKAIALAENLQYECIAPSLIRGVPMRLQAVIASGLKLPCSIAVCGVDNNPARIAASWYFRARNRPVVFAAVSGDGDHGYVFVQERTGPCIGCLFPDMVEDDRYPCPGTPAVADILQAVGALAVYAIDTLLMERPRKWNYRRISLSDGALDGACLVPSLAGCPLCQTGPDDACSTSH